MTRAVKRQPACCLIFLLALLIVSCSPAPPSMESLYAHEGTYELQPGHRVSLGISSEFGSALMGINGV